ncbi:kti12, chromatin associated [Physocladia obscura]|uniref:Kti12, chromatin associated n=1 Tax=Physocladia obscura TaxID=109957 RepID=A0AAD5XFG7_9FUNG|nr:kti12, chromatin associated [Physocladia obscura]
MPLIVMCGLPCAGKTRRAAAIAAELEAVICAASADSPKTIVPPTASKGKVHGSTVITPSYDPHVLIINEENLRIDRASAYRDTTAEKLARAALLSAVERHLSRDKFVILDSMNYIKGFRYQLHCIVKGDEDKYLFFSAYDTFMAGLGTSQHTVYCMAKPEEVISWNAISSQYPPEVLQSLLGRLEEPDGRNRWDSPLLCLLPDDPFPPSFIHNLIHSSVHQTPSQSIALKPVAETNYLHEMDSTLKSICDAILEAIQSGLMSGGELKVPGTDAKVLVPSKGISASEMGRLRRLYATNLNRLTIQVDKRKIADGFVEYINQNLR